MKMKKINVHILDWNDEKLMRIQGERTHHQQPEKLTEGNQKYLIEIF